MVNYRNQQMKTAAIILALVFFSQGVLGNPDSSLHARLEVAFNGNDSWNSGVSISQSKAERHAGIVWVVGGVPCPRVVSAVFRLEADSPSGLPSYARSDPKARSQVNGNVWSYERVFSLTQDHNCVGAIVSGVGVRDLKPGVYIYSIAVGRVQLGRVRFTVRE